MSNDRRRDLTPREMQRQRRKQQVQRRRLVAGLVLLGLIIVIVVVATTCGGGGGSTTTSSTEGGSTSTTLGAAVYKADLNGDNAVPAVDTTGTGTLTMTYDPATEELSYTLDLKNVTNPSVAAIYQGAEGESGAAVYTLFGGPTDKGPYTGVIAQGPIDPAGFTGSLEGGTIGDLIAMIQDGNAYVSVGTTEHPVDAIRGPIAASAEETTTTGGDDTGTTAADGSDTTETTAE